jgi:hypothetical protein
MLTTYYDDRTEMVIEWNGSATFNVQLDGVDVDCFTVYGKAQPAGPCTPQEAHDAAQAHFAQMATEERNTVAIQRIWLGVL